MKVVSLFVPPHVEAQLEKLRERTNTADSVGVCKKALALADWLIEEEANGNRIHIIAPDGDYRDAKVTETLKHWKGKDRN